MNRSPNTHVKVLVLDGASKAAAECVLALPESCEIHVAETTENCLSFASRRPARRLIQPVFTADLQAWIRERDQEEHYDLIIPATEVSLLALKAQSLDPALRAKAVIPDERSIDIALDKQQTLALAQQLGVKTPLGTAVTCSEDIPPWQGMPVVLKPAHSKVDTPQGVVALSVQMCRTEQERFEAYQRLLPLAPVLEQEYFKGRGVGIEVLFEHGEPRWLFAHERVHEVPITGGASTYRRSIVAPNSVSAAATALLRRLQWHGVAMVEFKVADEGDYRLMEINPRLWGSLPLAVAAGVNFPEGLLRIARGEAPGAQPRYRHKLYARDLAKDAIWFAQSWRERHATMAVKPLRAADFLELARPLLGREVWDLFCWRRPRMWWHLTRSTLANARSRLHSSAVRKAAAINWERLAGPWREGDIAAVLVLCYGNICRSPVTALLLQRMLPGVDVVSAGFHPTKDRQAPHDWTEIVATTLSLDLSSHRSRSVTPAMIAHADLIVVMEADHWTALGKMAPTALSKTILLGVAAQDNSLQGEEIADPYGKTLGDMRHIALAIEQCVQNIANQRPPANSTPNPK